MFKVFVLHANKKGPGGLPEPVFDYAYIALTSVYLLQYS